MEELIRHVRALIALQVRALGRHESDDEIRADLVLADLGFTAKEISALTGKSVTAVAKAITRARASASKESSLNQGGPDE
jgi:DNA-directed RNA polymerase specialized sigma24 family protein